MELVLPMYNVHPVFPSKIWAKKCALCTARYGTSCKSLSTVPGTKSVLST